MISAVRLRRDPSKHFSTLKGHMAKTQAVVIGDSLAGMCTARVLSDFFDKVVVIERDAYPEGVQDRPDVPQGRAVPVGRTHRPHTRAFCSHPWRTPQT
jgi:hypothetical protein